MQKKGKAGKKTMQPFVFRSRKYDLSGPVFKNPGRFIESGNEGYCSYQPGLWVDCDWSSADG